MLTKEDLLKGRDKAYPNDYTDDVSRNLDGMLLLLNKCAEAGAPFAKDDPSSSGWRPPAINGATKGAAKASTHQTGEAADMRDPKGELRKWVLANLALMKQLGLYMEDFRWTATWVHFQKRPPASGKRIYIPYADTKKFPMTAPKAWSGTYDKKYD